MANFKTDLQSNNIDLQTILDMVNNLPEAGSGSASGGSSSYNTIYVNDLEPSHDIGVDGDIWVTREATV